MNNDTTKMNANTQVNAPRTAVRRTAKPAEATGSRTRGSGKTEGAGRIPRAALHDAAVAHLSALMELKDRRAADWAASKECIGWDEDMGSDQRMARLHLLVTLMTIYYGRPSLKEEAFDEFERLLRGNDPQPSAEMTSGARAFHRASDWLTRMTRPTILEEAQMIADTDRKTFRREMDQLFLSRLRVLLADRPENIVQELEKAVPADAKMAGKVWVFGVAFYIFLDTRRQDLIDELETDLERIIDDEEPQTRGGKAFVRSRALLLLLLAKGFKKRGEIPPIIERLKLTA